jgi:hypothetical protein
MPSSKPFPSETSWFVKTSILQALDFGSRNNGNRSEQVPPIGRERPVREIGEEHQIELSKDRRRVKEKNAWLFHCVQSQELRILLSFRLKPEMRQFVGNKRTRRVFPTMVAGRTSSFRAFLILSRANDVTAILTAFHNQSFANSCLFIISLSSPNCHSPHRH